MQPVREPLEERVASRRLSQVVHVSVSAIPKLDDDFVALASEFGAYEHCVRFVGKPLLQILDHVIGDKVVERAMRIVESVDGIDEVQLESLGVRPGIDKVALCFGFDGVQGVFKGDEEPFLAGVVREPSSSRVPHRSPERQVKDDEERVRESES